MKTALALYFVLFSCYTPSAFALPAASQKRKVAQQNSEKKEVRVKQARELLGKYYKGSVVRVTEKVDAVRSFVEQEVKLNLPTKSKRLTQKTVNQIMKEGRRRHLDPLFILAIIMHESSMNPDAVGDVGELGLMQIRPETAEWIARMYKLSWTGARSLKDPAVNIRIGAAYLDYLRDQFDRHSRLYISAYNMGPANVRNALDRSVWPKDYVNSVMEHYIRFYSEIRDQRSSERPHADHKAGSINAS